MAILALYYVPYGIMTKRLLCIYRIAQNLFIQYSWAPDVWCMQPGAEAGLGACVPH